MMTKPAILLARALAVATLVAPAAAQEHRATRLGSPSTRTRTGAGLPASCSCWNSRMALDYYARSFVPEYDRFSIVVLDTDPFACDPHDLRHIRPLRTMVGGEWVFSR